MLSVNNISVQFSGSPLFESVSFIINKKDRIGLVGKNGSGKTTILKIISKLQKADSGEVAVQGNVSIGYLPQEMKISSNKTVYNEALEAFSDILFLERKIQKLSVEISERTDYESDNYLKLIQNLTEANENFDNVGGHKIHGNTEKVILGLGFKRNEFNQDLNTFSRGWQMRVELAKILLSMPDIILLDEPTNHLDIVSIQWLEDFLETYPGAVVVVSHDRAFLDNITKRTIEISNGKIYDYKASYSEYILLRDERIENQEATANNQQKQLKQVERFIERFRYKSTKAKQVQSKIKLLEKTDIAQVDELDNLSIKFRFPPAPHSGKIVLEANSIKKYFGKKEIFSDANFTVIKGEKIAFVGRNGEGKSTMSKIIVGDLDYEGNLKRGQNVKIGYYAQNQEELLDESKTVFQTIDDIAVGDIRPRIRAILGGFLFSGETIDKKVQVLSGGEKSRLSLAKLLLTPVNLLVLDEPTNHLDIHSKDILKNALLQFEGTLIIVSHDRDFLQGLTDRVFEFRNNRLSYYPGDIYDFLESRKLRSLKELENKEKSKNKSTRDSVSENKINYEKRKATEREIRKLSNQIKKSEKEIERLENEINTIDKYLANPEQFKSELENKDVFKSYENFKLKLDEEMKTWEELHSKLEKTQKS
ncbi:MAG: ATP-binding cassette domain-containing protein [Bacteroidales bacterium]|nr:ATP-binding cassette domain-containing protein [Bacteroidales bacterium]